MSEDRASATRQLRHAMRGPHRRSLNAALVVLSILLLGWWQATVWYEAALLSESKALAAIRASLRGNALSLSVGQRFALLRAIHATVQAEADAPDLGDKFEALAATLYAAPGARGVLGLTLAPDGVVCCVYPPEGSGITAGYVPLNDPRPQIRQDIARAIASGEITLSGPVEWTQGRTELAAWQAVYVAAQDGQTEDYWGLVGIVLDLAPLLGEAELDVQADVTLDYALRDGTGNVFYGTPTVFQRDPVIHLVRLPEGVWELAGVPGGGWERAILRPLRILQIAGLSIALLVAGGTYLSLRRQAELALAYAAQKAITEENVHLHEQAQRWAVLEERQRIARELHDSVSQALYGIGLGARTARELLNRDPSKAVAPVEYILSLAEGGLAEMRALILELHPDSLAREGLVSALNKQAAALRARHGLHVETVLGTEPDLPLGTKQGLYRIAQEALNNTIKHAQAGRVEIRLETAGDGVALSVHDDGIGFDPWGEHRGHIGLHTMQERAEQLGGVLHIESAPAQGTRIRVALSMSETPNTPPGRSR
jgi:signal transduction histidine kinase